MRKLLIFAPFLAFFVLIQSCQKNELPNEFNTILDEDFVDMQFQIENFGSPTLGSFIGVVKTEYGAILEDVQIQIGNAVTTTDRNGVFVMNNVNVFENFAYIKANKQGYMPGSRVVIPKPDGVNRIEIRLHKQEATGRVMAGEASELRLSGGAIIQFEGEFITEVDGNSYFGPVDVVAHYLRPNRGTTFFQMPGGLFGQTLSNEARGLETYGMVSVSLFSPANQPLQIAPDTKAKIKFPVDFSQTDIAPETVPLWSFDEELGYWKEEGVATKEDNYFVTEVDHFSWWNCDIPMNIVNLCFTLNPTNNTSATPYFVAIQRTLNDQYIYYGPATSGELECGWIPRDETLKIQVFGAGGSCANQTVYEEIVGGFSTDTSIELSFDEQLIYTNITGAVTDCSGNPLSDGYVYINGNNISPITDGIINISTPHCANASAILQVYDSNTGQWYAEDIVLNGNVIDVGSFSTCGDTGGIYNGDVSLTTQEEVNSFGLFGYARITGRLSISSASQFESNISDLTPLQNLEEVSGRFSISALPLLENLNGLENLRSVSDFSISYNESLTSLSAIATIESINRLSLIWNGALTSLDDLDAWDFELPNLNISRNLNLASISGLRNVTIMEDIYIENVSTLTNLEELNFSNPLDLVQFRNNPDLISLTGLENVIEIDYLYVGGNQSLQTLDGLDNLMTNKGFMIGFAFEGDYIADAPNPSLTNFCAVRNFLINGTYIDPPTAPWNGVRIDWNAFNPSIQMIQDGNCSQ
jgi:hypothetical protein